MNTPRTPTLGNRFFGAIIAALALFISLPGIARAAQEVSSAVKTQIQALLAEKEARTPAQKKMDSQLVYFAKQRRGEVIAAAAPRLTPDVKADAQDRVLVDLNATVSSELLDAITRGGGTVVNHFAAFRAIRAQVPIGMMETLAERGDVRSIGPAAMGTTNVGSALSQGDRTHRADTARANTGATGSGIKIGVLSDGVNSLPTSIANGNINPSATFLAGQAGSGDEGTAMMEIIQDLVPDAQLIFATANTGDTQFAANIVALQNAGCTIIVDDFTYFNESPFQDAVISQAVNTVSAAGAMYFSSARNSGNKNDGTAGTWEGDFVSGGLVAAPVTGTGNLLDFGGGVTFDTVASGGSQRRVDLFWSDPMGASANDYDLFVLDATGTNVLRSSTNVQNGTQNPYESTGTLNVGERIVIVQRTGAANRFVHLDTGRAVLAISTIGNVRGHNASGAANAFSVAAPNVANSPSPNFFTGGATNPVETFSSDGPRRMFYDPSGTPFTPGDVSSTGGTVLNKPDITAADGVTTSVVGFTSFFGTSAAAPHAAAIAALLKSYNPTLTPAQIRTAFTSTALDIEAVGNDRDSGAGIVMALAAIQAVPAPDFVISGAPLLAATGPVGGPFQPVSATYTVTNTGAASLDWTAAKTQAWTTLSSAGGTLAPGASVTVTCSLNATANGLGTGTFSDTVTITNTTAGFARTFNVSLKVSAVLTGTKTVGPSGANYTSLTGPGGLFDAINSSAVSGTLTVQIIGNLTSETGGVALNAINGTTPAVKIFPTGAARSITGSIPGALLRLNGADNVTLDGSLNGTGTDRSLTITNTNSGTGSAVVWLQNNGADGATNNTIKNLNVAGSGNTQTLLGIGSGGGIPGITSFGIGNNGNTIQNNNISKCQYGICSTGASTANKNTGNVISQNLINTASPNNVAKGGILVSFENSILITRNTVDGPTFTSSPDVFGISLGWTSISSTGFTGNEVTNATVTRNVIGMVTNTGTFSAAGIAVASATSGTTLIANNFVYGVGADGSSGDIGAGILLGGGTGSTTQVYFNSVSMTGTITGSVGTYPSYALAIGGSNPVVDARDNVLLFTQVTNGTGIGYAIGTASTTFTNLTSDHNVMFTSTGALFGVGKTGGLSTSGTTRTTLANWQSATGKDTNTVFANPLFASTTNLHITNATSPAWQTGTPIAAITTDIDGEARGTTPNIGADDVTPTVPVVSANPSNTTVTVGANASFTAAATGLPAPAVQWQVSTNGGANFNNIGGATASPFSFATAIGDNGSQYRAVFTNVAGSATTTAATLTVLTLQEAWRKQYFNITTNTGNAADTADPDGDGQNNLFEYVAGLVPNDAISRFKVRVEPVAGQPTQKAIIFSPVVAGRTYVVKYKASHDDPWTALTNITTSDNGTERTVTDLSAAPGPRFYMVEITLP
jgi:hypothetical protein